MQLFRVLAQTDRLFVDDLEAAGAHQDTHFAVKLAGGILYTGSGCEAMLGSEFPVWIELPQVDYLATHCHFMNEEKIFVNAKR